MSARECPNEIKNAQKLQGCLFIVLSWMSSCEWKCVLSVFKS